MVNSTNKGQENNLNLTDIKVFKLCTQLSFKYLLEFWQKEVDTAPGVRKVLAEQVLAHFPENHPLRAEIVDLGTAQQYEEEVDLLMTAAVPISAREHRLTGAFVPFHYAPVFATKAFMELRYAPDSLAAETHKAFDIKKTRSAYAFILKTFYGQQVDPSYRHLIETLEGVLPRLPE